MHEHTCPRCRQKFHAPLKIDGLVCRACTAPASEWDELVPTRPRVIHVSMLAVNTSR